ncbi:hypothetical protein NL108_014098 [Boleophthalmus pectinirostris]|nr:hypothetical protein NL108_014098 [Boleophthalmus pectinirostris]
MKKETSDCLNHPEFAENILYVERHQSKIPIPRSYLVTNLKSQRQSESHQLFTKKHLPLQRDQDVNVAVKPQEQESAAQSVCLLFLSLNKRDPALMTLHIQNVHCKLGMI